MMGAWTYLLLFIYLFDIRMSIFIRVMFGPICCVLSSQFVAFSHRNLLRSLIAICCVLSSFGWMTKNNTKWWFYFLGTFSKELSASPGLIHFLSGDSWWYGTCLGFWAFVYIPASILNPTSIAFPVLGSLMFSILWNTSLYSLIGSFVDFG